MPKRRLNNKLFPEPSEAPTNPLWRGVKQVRHERGRLRTMGQQPETPGLDQAAHMATSRGQRGLSEFWRWKGAFRKQLAQTPLD